MGELDITEGHIPRLDGKVALITGGAAGIGLALAKILLAKGCIVHAVDLRPPDADADPEAQDWDEWEDFHVHRADVRCWAELRAAFAAAGRVDLYFANAGITDLDPSVLDGYYLDDVEEADGGLCEPAAAYQVVETNVRGVLNTVKLARYSMRKQGVREGSIVITGSTAAYWPDGIAPIASASWGAQLNLIRALKHRLPQDGITINGVAPFVAISRCLPLEMGLTFMENAVPLSESHDVALALAYSATARQPEIGDVAARWNGRVIHVTGDQYHEVEVPLEALRDTWFGLPHADHVRKGQALTRTMEP